ncbi:MAG: hypothetical protein IJP98_05425 [Clostridia bacterium]|nr:hypothetical protein [Clostridia bacterium]
MSRKNRVLAGVVGLLLLAVVLFAAFYIAAEADHDCAGEDCPVCACIRLCEAILHRIGGGKTEQSFLLVSTVLLVAALTFSAFAASANTPVSEKIRLNN